jgi:hypothetical protein
MRTIKNYILPKWQCKSIYFAKMADKNARFRHFDAKKIKKMEWNRN